ncbi:hypothetical protein [Microbacterium sp. Leaf159]|uniref:hypothetical protein n=1 Tax=Microbacterium sp. Leaf159 TaxID=1736279 RepID=UPI0007157449|nr:hypothetical protein [Microbacterium sp. Leaf159]KQR39204.1 hypothetical protein ASF80_07190 [Microbacterium sp. Leaf159]
MDSGIAVIVGALIALTGSSVVPWVRESLKARQDQQRDRRQRLRESVVHVLAANQMVGVALHLKIADRVVASLQERSTATAELLVTVAKDERGDISRVLARSIPMDTDNDGTKTYNQVRALQVALVSWVNDEIPSTALNPTYDRVLAKTKQATPKD